MLFAGSLARTVADRLPPHNLSAYVYLEGVGAQLLEPRTMS